MKEREPLKIYLQIQLSKNKHLCMAKARLWLNQTGIYECILKFKMLKSVKTNIQCMQCEHTNLETVHNLHNCAC